MTIGSYKILVMILFLSNMAMIQTKGYSQKLNLSDDRAIKEHLNKKTYIIGKYGEIEFKYDEVDRINNFIVFDVKYVIYGNKKKTMSYLAKIPLGGPAMFMEFRRDFFLEEENQTMRRNEEYPIYFELLENGELFCTGKNLLKFQEYYEKHYLKGEPVLPINEIIKCEEKK